VEIREQVGADNFFLFGKTTDQIAELRGHYRPWALLESMPLVQEAFNLLAKGFFSRGDSELFQPLLHNLRSSDPFFLLADFSDYLSAQNHLSRIWREQSRWTRMSVLNTARSGFFSSDRAIRTYASTIWSVEPCPLEVTVPQ
jgi:starch phosphorylase